MEGYVPEQLKEEQPRIVKYNDYVGTWGQAIVECPFLRGFDDTTRDMILEEGAQNFEQLPPEEAMALREDVYAKLATAQSRTEASTEKNDTSYTVEEQATEITFQTPQEKPENDNVVDAKTTIDEKLILQEEPPRSQRVALLVEPGVDAQEFELTVIDDGEVKPKADMQISEDLARMNVSPETKQYLHEAAVPARMSDEVAHDVAAVQMEAVDESAVAQDTYDEQLAPMVNAHVVSQLEQDTAALYEIRQEVEATFDLADHEVSSNVTGEQEAVADESPSDVESDVLPDSTLLEYSAEMHDEAVEHVMLLVGQALAEQDEETWQDELPEALQNEPAIAVEVASIDAPDLVLSNVKHAILAFEAEATPEESEQMDMLFAEMTQITEFLTELQSRDIATAAEILESQPTNTTGEVIEHMPLTAITEEQLIARLEIVCERMLVMLDAPHDREHVQVMVHQLITLVEDREAWDKSKALTPEELAVMGTREYKLAFHQQLSDDRSTIGHRFKQIGAAALGVFEGIVPHGVLVPARS